MGRSGAARTVLAVVLSALAACSAPAYVIGDAPPGDRRSTPGVSTARPITAAPGVSFSARPGAVEGALAAYRGFLSTTAVAAASPPAAGRPWPKGGDVTAYSVDPARAAEVTQLHAMAQRGEHFVGVPIAPRPIATVTGTDRVQVLDCPVPSQGWKLVARDGSTAWSPPAGWAPQPNPIEATLVFRDGRWAVAKLVVDTSRTCTP